MKVIFEQSSPWPVGKMTAGTLPPATEPGLFVTPVHGLIDHWAPWKRKAINWAVPADAKVDVVTESKAQSALDWPIEIIESVIVVDNKAVEARITVLYFFMEWCAVVVFRAPPDQLAANRDKAMPVLLSARPDWSTPEVVSLSQLYRE